MLLSGIRLSGGNSSPFKININGIAANEAMDLEINAHDSLYVFVQVNAKPSGTPLPFILKDSIELTYNGNTRFVQLRAYGQNAVFLKQIKLTGTVNWNNSLPYVIIGGLQVDSNAVLNIAAGTKIYLHADAPFLVDGTLMAEGSKEAPIVFSGDRRDDEYKNLPASWPGIYFSGSSKNNVLEYVVVKNAYQGIIAQGPSTTSNPKLTLSKCIIDNIYDAGIIGINTEIYADNSLISNCGSNIIIALGGNYRFINCTAATYASLYISHKNPVLQVADFLAQEGVNYTAPLNAFFQNCIIWGENGSVENEIIVNKKGAGPFAVTFDHVLYKAKDDPANAAFISSMKNIPPAFDSINTSKNSYDFHITKYASPAIDAGATTIFKYDLDGKPRDGNPDIGCYEK